MIIIVKLTKALVKCRTRAFTLLESLCVLLLTSFLLASLSGSVKGVFTRVQEELFFLSFEQLYRQTQNLSISRQKEMMFYIDRNQISNEETVIKLPDSVQTNQTYQLKLNQSGGHSSLSKIVFTSQNKTVVYQFYIGSGNYKKTER
ncbi:competence type IV pilus minor pilin ComGD [Streptococcus sp. sy010]|uniref:competence type IV pilus minor pilin ComGD n=1 Tax=Streptococcus sp. sy010 TaxID=2600148 RepID=UPI0011B71E04|nr:competence type IV pilus minor pilin ComGD [Streptococcus sp. sy010]TWT13389.1 competence protein [Streptococcus sp. sy010]